MRTKSLLFSAIFALAAASPAGAREKILSLNEAIWPGGIGSINYLVDNKLVSNNWFEEVNDGEELGYTPNDIIQVNDNLFAIAVNYSHTVVFIDAAGHMVGKLLDGDTGDGATPNCRFLVSDGTYLYLTGYDHRLYCYLDPDDPDNWTEEYWDEGGYVAKIDPTTFKVIAYTPVGWEPDRIAIYGGKLFVFNSGGYGPVVNPNTGTDEHSDYESTVSIVDAETMTVERVLDTTRINLYRGLSQSGKWLLANSAGDYYETYPSMILIDCDKVLAGDPDEECYVYNPNFASTYSTATLDGKFMAIGSAFSYDSMGYEYKYITLDPQKFWDGNDGSNVSNSGIYEEMPGTMLDDIKAFSYPYDIYQNPYSGYYYATDAGAATSGDESGGLLYQWDPEGNLVDSYTVGVFPAHILAVKPHKSPVRFVLSSKTPTAALIAKDGSEKIDLTTPVSGTTYSLDIFDGEYTLVAYNKNGEEAGSIELSIPDSFEEQTFTIQAPTIYATNSGWSYGTDYTVDVVVTSPAGEARTVTLGKSATEGRQHFLALKGDSYRAAFVPSEAHVAEGYATVYRNGTLTFDATASATIPMAGNMVITLPADASLQIGRKTNHFVDFTPVEAASSETADGVRTVTYSLPEGETFYYRTWREGGLTQAGYFVMNSQALPSLEFTEASYTEIDPRTVNHDFSANDGYETGDILVNVNERGHLSLSKGDSFRAHAMRSWQIIDGITSNNFVEPDFHFTAYNVTIDTKAGTAVVDAEPSETVVSISHEPGSAWADIKAVGSGTAIVLVTYDAIRTVYYDRNGAEKPFTGGDMWGAIWPENTAVYVVTVDQRSNSRPEMSLHKEFNVESEKVAGFNLDAEHDIFYFPDTEEGYLYTVKPYNVKKDKEGVWVSSPVITEDGVTYTEFTPCESNGDGSYNVLLREGRNIIRLVSVANWSTYQVVTAHACGTEITNLTSPGSEFKAGDEVEVAFTGLRHPSNKLAGIYNMSAKIVYNNLPGGISITTGSNQYKFGSADGARSFKFTVPESVARSGESYTFSGGAIQVTGFGDPFGSHRDISPEFGRSPNFTAVSHKAMLGVLPTLTIDPKSTSGVEDVSVSAEPIMYYNLQGISSSEPFRGLNIVVYSDGSVRKIHYNL